MAPTASTSKASASSSSNTSAGKKTRQPSRKSKASWRRNIDLEPIEAHLESARAAERLGLQPIANADSKDSDLFEVDVKGDEEVRSRLGRRGTKKPMRSLQSLVNESAVPAASGRRGGGKDTNSTSRKGNGKMSKAEMDRLKRIASRPVIGPFGAIVESEQGNALETVKGAVLREPEEDVWQGIADSEEQEVDEALDSPEEEDWIEAARVKPVKTPSHLVKSVRAAGQASASSSSHPAHGQSYNPTLKSHTQLLQEAYEFEKAKMEAEERNRAFKEKWRLAGKAAAEGEQEGKMWQGMLLAGDNNDSEDDEEDLSAILEADEETAAKRAAESLARSQGIRKTKAEKTKALRSKKHLLELEKAKEAKKAKSSLSQVPHLSKSLKARLKAQEVARQAKKEAKLERLAQRGLAGSKVGKYAVPVDASSRSARDVQLGEELSDGLRGVRVEGNLWKDGWERMQIKGNVEPRVPVGEKGSSTTGGRKDGGRKRRLRMKEYETHSYRKFV